MERRDKRKMHYEEGADQHKPSSSELLRMMGGKSRHAGKGAKRSADSVIAVYRNRVTYTFIMDGEVASIHYDRRRHEIFFRGHNIRNMELSDKQKGALEAMKRVLAADEQGRAFLQSYSATLGRLLADK